MDVATTMANHLAAEGQIDSRARNVVGMGALEDSEDILVVLCGDAGTVVGDRQRMIADRARQGPCRIALFEGIADEVLEHLVELNAIEVHAGQLADFKRGPGLAERKGEILQGLIESVAAGEVDILVHGDAAGADKTQQASDEGAHPRSRDQQQQDHATGDHRRDGCCAQQSFAAGDGLGLPATGMIDISCELMISCSATKRERSGPGTNTPIGD